MAQAIRANLRTRLKRILQATLLVIVGAAALAYGLDFTAFEIRVLTRRNPYGSVLVNPYYAVGLKNGKTEFISILRTSRPV